MNRRNIRKIIVIFTPALILFLLLILKNRTDFSYPIRIYSWDNLNITEESNKIINISEDYYVFRDIDVKINDATTDVTINDVKNQVTIKSLDRSQIIKKFQRKGDLFISLIGRIAADDYYSYIQQTSDGGYVLLVESWSIEQKDIFVIKLDSVGNLQWAKSINGLYINKASYIHQSSDEGYIVIGESSNGNRDIIIFKLDSNGNLQWAKTIDVSVYDDYSYIQQT